MRKLAAGLAAPHVLPGDILAPEGTAPLRDLVLAWLGAPHPAQ